MSHIGFRAHWAQNIYKVAFFRLHPGDRCPKRAAHKFFEVALHRNGIRKIPCFQEETLSWVGGGLNRKIPLLKVDPARTLPWYDHSHTWQIIVKCSHWMRFVRVILATVKLLHTYFQLRKHQHKHTQTHSVRRWGVYTRRFVLFTPTCLYIICCIQTQQCFGATPYCLRQ